MDFLRPASREEALAAKAEHPTAVPIAGGTDVMVEIDFGHRRPEYPLDLNCVGELYEWEPGGQSVRPCARVPYRAITRSLRAEPPGPALASHPVASPRIRDRGGFGGNLGTASPAGDVHPALLAAGAEVEVASAARGTRLIPVDASRTGVERNARGPDPLIPTILDTPAMPVDVLELADEHAPYGVRGAGEAPTLSSAPAVLAAIRDATGLQLDRTPVRPEHRTGTV
ncbi:FAD binding domain-containing protein [Streptomyces sp. MBT70]|nr:FAD binding domain-containing protein [Streptomyces sp. MBT70]GGR73639.1 hypothetical protein GCM10010236_30070 [Streptomyces eurythermus]